MALGALVACCWMLSSSRLEGQASRPWENGQHFRRSPLAISPSGKTGFTRLDGTATGVIFTNTLTLPRALANANLMNGSGVALGDYDNDGLCDLFLCNLNGTNALFKNLGGWKFKDVTVAAGAVCSNQTSTAAVFADVNGDRALDLLVTSMGGPHACFINNGKGQFSALPGAGGITSRYGAMSMALGDVDGNGTLDLYVANYGLTSIIRSGGALNVSYDASGKPVIRGRYAQRIKIIDNVMYELGEPDALYLNDGTGRFSAVSWTDGHFLNEEGQILKTAEIPWDQGLSVVFRDVNGDLAPDIYVCNDAFTPDRFWINDGKGRFRALPSTAWRSTSYFSMGADFADFDRDQDDDLFVVDMLSREHELILTQKGTMPDQPRLPGEIDKQIQMRRNTLFQNRGDGTFAEIAYYAGVAGSEWSWSAIFLDVDLDGWEDLLVSNGFAFNMDDMDVKEQVARMGPLKVEESRRTLLLYPPLHTPNLAFRNNRDLTFRDESDAWGFNAKEVSNGTALADLDNDGDLDVVINCLNGPALLLRNDTAAPRMAVRLKGKAPNTQGIGAKIKVAGGPVAQSQEVMSGGRYVSGDDPLRVFACGSATNRLTIEVTWRSGSLSRVENAEANFIYEIDEMGAAPKSKENRTAPAPLFADASALLNHRHIENPFDDFLAQRSLPYRLSQMGPALAWHDFDHDGFEDLVIGASLGGSLAFYRNNGKGGFEARTNQLPDRPEVTSLAAYRTAEGQSELLLGRSNFEIASKTQVTSARIASPFTLAANDLLAGTNVIGPLAITELEGQLVLFCGGRFVPRRYPEPAPSFLLRKTGGEWRVDPENSSALNALGLVTAGIWADLNSDGASELIAACEWGAVRVFEMRGGKLLDRTAQWGLDPWIGLWQSVAAADFDGDGRMDLIAGNWGLNSFYHQAPNHQVEIYYGDFNGTGQVEIIEAYSHPKFRASVPWRDRKTLGVNFPWLEQTFPTFKQFAQSTMPEILKGRLERARVIKTTTLASMLFLNRGERFEARPLPAEAQFTPIFGMAVADWDGDGLEDAFLSQNFFAGRENDSRLDAGRGLLLRGGGAGTFSPLSAEASGIAVYGEQRGCAAADFDADGRMDLAITQNGNATKLYRNTGGIPGIRVRLAGPAHNLDAAGAQVRLRGGAYAGPLRQVQIGSSYLSQSSRAMLLPRREEARDLEILWPGGTRTTNSIPQNALEIEATHTGALRIIK